MHYECRSLLIGPLLGPSCALCSCDPSHTRLGYVSILSLSDLLLEPFSRTKPFHVWLAGTLNICCFRHYNGRFFPDLSTAEYLFSYDSSVGSLILQNNSSKSYLWSWCLRKCMTLNSRTTPLCLGKVSTMDITCSPRGRVIGLGEFCIANQDSAFYGHGLRAFCLH